MTREQTIAAIETLLATPQYQADREIWHDAEAIYERLPCTLCEYRGDINFADAVWFTSHDLFRDLCETEA